MILSPSPLYSSVVTCLWLLKSLWVRARLWLVEHRYASTRLCTARARGHLIWARARLE